MSIYAETTVLFFSTNTFPSPVSLNEKRDDNNKNNTTAFNFHLVTLQIKVEHFHFGTFNLHF